MQKWVFRSRQTPIATDPFCPSDEIRPGAMGSTTNTVQPSSVCSRPRLALKMAETAKRAITCPVPRHSSD